MAAVLRQTWCRTVTTKQCLLLRSYATASAQKDEGMFKRVKKFVFGEVVEPFEHSESVYYDIKDERPALVYSMNSTDIKEKIDSIIKEMGDLNMDMTDDMVKYQVLSRCQEEFGVLFPSYQLNKIKQTQDIEEFYCSLSSHSKPLNIIDTDNLPANLKVGGKVPRK